MVTKVRQTSYELNKFEGMSTIFLSIFTHLKWFYIYIYIQYGNGVVHLDKINKLMI